MPNTQIRLLEQLRLSILNLDNANDTSIADERANVIEALQQLGIDTTKALANNKDSNDTIKTDTDKLDSPVDRSQIKLPKTKTARQNANDKAIELLERIEANGLTRADLSQDEITTLAKYTGNGGNLVNRDGKKGSQYEYYTPKEVAAGMWDLAEELGFNGGKVLDPSAGTGVFAATSPENAVINNIELDRTSGAISKILNDGKRSETVVSPFEKQAALIPDDSLDMVMTNVPFGENSARGDNKLEDNAYQNESLENYFILRSLEKVKPGGLAIFITPTNIVDGKRADKKRLRLETSLKAEFLGGYRLPTSVFEQTAADVTTDIVVYRKHSIDAIEAIKDIYNSGDLDSLKQANVLWSEYLDGTYFKESGKKHVLGEVKTKNNQYGKEIEYVHSTDLPADTAKKIKKFSNDSRIDWAAIDASQPELIEYHNGDTIFQNGKQLRYEDGLWVQVEKEVTDTDRAMQELIANMGNAQDMAVSNVTWTDVENVKAYMRQTGQIGLLPESVEKLIAATRTGQSRQSLSVAWRSMIVGTAIDNALTEHGFEYNHKEGNSQLTNLMKQTYLDGKNSSLKGEPARLNKLIGLHYNNGEYSVAWRGAIDATIEDDEKADNYKNKLARMQYKNKSLYLSKDELKEIHPDIDPMTNDDWFVSSDGAKVIHADDFLVGTLADRLADIDKQIEAAANDEIKAKLINQKTVARSRISKIDFKRMQYDLRTPLIDAETKVTFLKQFGIKNAYVRYDDNGKAHPDVSPGKSDGSDIPKLQRRIGAWLGSGSITLATTKLKMTDRQALDWLSDTINKANIEFNAWVKSNDMLIKQLDKRGNDPKNLYFAQNADDAPIDIAGMNPKLNLHGYQNEFVRKQGRFFGGINGMGVGLGKTFSALASAQHVQNIGAKKKTLFVVPNSVLSNWRKEAKFAYESTDDCIFVGLREKGGKFKVHSSKYDEDLLKAIDGKYRKVFMTYEAFRRIRLKEDSITGYANYLRSTDQAYAHKELKKKDEKSKGLVAELIDNIKIKSNAPYLEDMRVDSIVIDEAHAFKNSITAPETDNRVKYLSLPQTSGRGEDAQAKLWYIRSKTQNNDGVQLLSATPITNSPLEIYSMLSLAGGRDMVNSMAAGVMGADDFIKVMCQIEEEVVPTIDGKERSQNVFTGIRNVQIIRNAIQSTSTIKNAQDVGLSVVIPDRDEKATSVTLSPNASSMIETYQLAYQYAKKLVKAEGGLIESTGDPELDEKLRSAYSTVSEMFNEGEELIAHPFNLIRKMDVMIADEDFSKQATFYDFDQKQRDIAQKAIDEFNKNKPKDERSRLSMFTKDEDATEIFKKDGDKKELVGYKVSVRSSIIIDEGRERIMIDTLDSNVQSKFESIAEKMGLKLSVTVAPKVAAMLDNFKAELASPRGIESSGAKSKIVKQIIFCDHLFLHNKIKRLIAERTNIPASKIVIITGQTNNEPDQMIDIQDGFNAESEDNKYQVVIANQKAEVGINLQKGTQAIHHLTTGWTPDSLEQRNGRGARQGNKTEKVTIYHYDADGTFDEFKRTMISKKDEWISSLLANDDKNNVDVKGGLSREEQEALIEIGGDKEAIKRYQEEKDKKEEQARIETAKRRQSISLDIINKQREILEKASPKTMYQNDIKDVVSIIRENKKNASGKPGSNKAKKYEAARSEAVNRLDDILKSVVAYNSRHVQGEPADNDYIEIDINGDELYQLIEKKSGDFTPSMRDGYQSGKNQKGRPWDQEFESILTRHLHEDETSKPGFNVWHYSISLTKDNDYQFDYEQTVDRAKKMIDESGKVIDEISKNIGGLPLGAGKKIASGEAALKDGVYIESGAIVIVKNQQDKLGAVSNELEFFEIANGGRYARVYAAMDNIDIILPNDSRYLDHVKKLAAIEDSLYDKGDLNEPYYSNLIPAVADYRDESIIPSRKLKNSMTYTKIDQLSGAPIPFMLTMDLIASDTPFSKELKADYEKAGIVFDLDARTYKAQGKAQIDGELYINADNKDQLISAISDYIRANDLKLTKDDKVIREVGDTIIGQLVKVNKSDVNDKISEAMNKVVQSYLEDDISPDTVTRINDAVKIADEIIMPNTYFEIDAIGPDSKNRILGALVDSDRVAENQNASFHLKMRYDEASQEKRRQELRDSAANKENNSDSDDSAVDFGDGIAPTDIVYITGEAKKTMYWKDKFKPYAEKYNEPVSMRRGRKIYAKWNRNQVRWELRYKGFAKFLEDYPKAKDELNIEKA